MGRSGCIRSVFALAVFLAANQAAAQGVSEEAVTFFVKALPPVSCDSMLLGVKVERFARPDAALCGAALEKSMDGRTAFWPERQPRDKPGAYLDRLSAAAARFCKALMDAHGVTRIEPNFSGCVLGVPSDPASVFGGLMRALLAKKLPRAPGQQPGEVCMPLPLPATNAASRDIVFGNLQDKAKPGAGKADVVAVLEAEGFLQGPRAPDRYSRIFWMVVYDGQGETLHLRPLASLDFTFDETPQLCFDEHALGH